MLKIKFTTLAFLLIFLLSACKTVSNKIEEKTALEEKELSKWLDKSESELKIKYGNPDKVEYLKSKNKNYIYTSEKLKIKCERKFEISPKNIVVGFKSKNCF